MPRRLSNLINRRVLAAILPWLSAAPSALLAQGLVTDRPDFTESAVVVPSGAIQFEAGLTSAELSEFDTSELTAGELLVRWGLTQRLEARLQAPSFLRASTASQSESGFSDMAVGAKYQIGPLGTSSPVDVAFIGMVSIPTGDASFGSDAVEPSVILVATRDISDKVGVGGQLVASLPEDADGRALQWGATLVVGTSVSAVGLFVEAAIDIPREGTAPVVGHFGAAIPVSEGFQIDVHAGFGLTDTAPDLFFGAGLALGI